MTNEIILYDFTGSPCARRVKISLLEKKISFFREIIDLTTLEQRHPDYLKINPNGLVPSLVHNSHSIWESNVITEYLDDAFPDIPLYPQDPWLRIQAKKWQTLELALAKYFRPIAYHRVLSPLIRIAASLDEVLAKAKKSTNDKVFLKWEEKVWRGTVLSLEEENLYKKKLCEYLTVIEQQLIGKKYLLGDNFSTADISIFPRIEMYPFVGIKIDSKRYPNTFRWLKLLKKRSSFAKTGNMQQRLINFTSNVGILTRIIAIAQKKPQQHNLTDKIIILTLRPILRIVFGFSKFTQKNIRKNPIVQPKVTTLSQRPAWFARRNLNTTDTFVLMGDKTSVSTRKIETLLSYLGIDYQFKEIPLALLHHRSKSFLQINPSGEVPVLKHGERIISETQVIAEYLALHSNQPQLIGTTSLTRAQVRMWHAFDCGMHKETRPLFFLTTIRPWLLQNYASFADLSEVFPKDIGESDIKWLNDVYNDKVHIDMGMQGAIDILEQKIEKINQVIEAEKYLVGNQPSFADLSLALRIMQIKEMVTINWQQYTGLLLWLDKICNTFVVRM